MTQQSAIFLQNRRRPETSRTRPNKKEIGKYREAAGSPQRQRLLFYMICLHKTMRSIVGAADLKSPAFSHVSSLIIYV